MAEKWDDANMIAMLNHRMGWNVGNPRNPFRRMLICKLDEEKAVLFFVIDKRTYTIEDELGLYPSDALVTKLRLIEGGETS